MSSLKRMRGFFTAGERKRGGNEKQVSVLGF
jgi:hypothetical protein